MLALLHIENIAVIESADIPFAEKFNVLTGETGAGKSIVVDAIGAVMGQRTNRDLIRTGADRALVSAVFEALPALPWFEETGICPDENGQLIVVRELQPDGRNLCRVNGRPVTVAQLKTLGGQLINIHGQHDGQQLMDESFHLAYLDRFGNLEGPIADYRAAYEQLKSVEHQRDALQMDEAERARRVDSLTHQIAELERAALQPGEEETLDERRRLLRSADRLMDALERAHCALSGDENVDGAADLIGTAEGALARVASYSDEIEALTERLAEVGATLADAADTVRDLRARVEAAPGELDAVEARLDLLYRLKRKYGTSVDDMLVFLSACRTELDDIESGADTLLRLEQKHAEALEQVICKAKLLSTSRQETAVRLQTRIAHDLSELDMPGVRFAATLTPRDTPDANGMDEVRFLMSANAGEALKPIRKVASGGELARIMLAMKNVLAEDEDVTTLIFDEVDTGVSGRAAGRVAEKLASVARHKQVLCVTHLPQLAAMADTHFSVEKAERDGHTYTRVEQLVPERRREELARLTGGAHITSVMIEAAGELLAAAEDYKNQNCCGN